MTAYSLNPLAINLNGTHLIEASAGTGKTFTIAVLVLRLILEKKLLPRNILVVTFTEAATDELRDRIRKRLHQALIAFENGYVTDKKDTLLTQILDETPDHNKAIELLKASLRGFDEASIFTIHAFCRQVLQENAFESGVLFNIELIKEQKDLLHAIVEDFWRQHFYHASPLFLSYILNIGYDKPEKLLTIIGHGRYIGQPFLNIIPEKINASSPKQQEQSFLNLFIQIKEQWQRDYVDIKTLLLQDKNLNGNLYRKTSIPQWCEALNAYFNAPSAGIMLPEKFDKFTNKSLQKGTKKGEKTPTHDFFNLCDEFQAAQQSLTHCFETYLLSLKQQLFDVIETQLKEKKQQKNVYSFDDLLINVYQALIGKSGEYLINLLKRKYRAALIDEFQDTDPVQYKIFDTIYNDNSSTLFMIGDPKQAIYSFRGADIFTYIAASRQTNYQHTLDTNWRSDARLIQAVNSLFKRDDLTHPFVFKDIPFHPAKSPNIQQSNIKQSSFTINDEQLAPLQLWFISRQDANYAADKMIAKSWANQHIPYAVGNEIAYLLNLGQQGLAKINERPVVAGDIAVLVPTNRQARVIQDALTTINIPSVLYSRESLFTSHEAMEVERLLIAIADPQNEGLVKAALTTDMLGITGSHLYELVNNERLWQEKLKTFQKYNFIWQTIGFIQMYRKLLVEQKIQERLLTYPNGERRLTNTLHLGEMLQQATVQKKLGISSLCAWLSQQRLEVLNNAETDDDTAQLRLESDEKLVKIVTIHKSKGLQYPIVFCPFLWDGALHNKEKKKATKKDENPFTFHDENDKLILDLGSKDKETHRKQALKEERAEKLRLFYVAVTRAEHRCYLAWGNFNDATTSPLAHLLHPNKNVDKSMDDAELFSDLKAIAKESDNTLQIKSLPTTKSMYQRPIPKLSELKARHFQGKIENHWAITSFTTLSAKKSTFKTATAELPDYDENVFEKRDMLISELSTESNIFTFPRGAKAGTFMHSVFEKLDFLKPDPNFLQQQLELYGYEVEQWQTTIEKLVHNVLTTPLPQTNFTLSTIQREKRLNELEFFYPLNQLATKQLQTILLQYINEPKFKTAILQFNFAEIQGFMKGYIDMIVEQDGQFYLFDYKSNFLGSQKEDYHFNNLIPVMAKEGYFLQYLIYSVALHRYLKVRLPNYDYEQHFGGVYYLFLRGMQPEWGNEYGIYMDKPSKSLITTLSDYFSPTSMRESL